MSIFIVSDTHFSAKRNDCTSGTDYLGEKYKSYIALWNRIVSPSDVVIHLGDALFNPWCLPIFGLLNGRKHLVLGNHDVEYIPPQEYFGVRGGLPGTIKASDIPKNPFAPRPQPVKPPNAYFEYFEQVHTTSAFHYTNTGMQDIIFSHYPIIPVGEAPPVWPIPWKLVQIPDTISPTLNIHGHFHQYGPTTSLSLRHGIRTGYDHFGVYNVPVSLDHIRKVMKRFHARPHLRARIHGAQDRRRYYQITRSAPVSGNGAGAFSCPPRDKTVGLHNNYYQTRMIKPQPFR